jgi:hypothetical protein
MKFIKEKEVAKRLLYCGFMFAEDFGIPKDSHYRFALKMAESMSKELSKVFVDSCKEMDEKEQEYASNTYVFYKRVEKELKFIHLSEL